MSRSKLILVRKHTHRQCLYLLDTLTQWSKYYYDIYDINWSYSCFPNGKIFTHKFNFSEHTFGQTVAVGNNTWRFVSI